MFEWTRAWIRLRAEHLAIRSGRLIDLSYDNDSYVFARQDKGETVIVAFNRAAQQKKLVLPAGAIDLKDGSTLVGTIGSREIARIGEGSVTLTLPSRAAAAYVVR
jgi:hypothetical protein